MTYNVEEAGYANAHSLSSLGPQHYCAYWNRYILYESPYSLP